MATLAVGDKIKAIRQKKHMTQRELADLIGCKSSFISHIEHNSRNISVSYLQRIAEALETPAYRLMATEDDEHLEATYLLDGLDKVHFAMAMEYLEYLTQRQKKRTDPE